MAISSTPGFVPGTSTRHGFRPKRIDSGAIFETLRYRISTLEYPPGTALKEIELSGQFGVSRTPIRQALQRLEIAGLVRPVIGHGTIVTSLDLLSVQQLLQYRLRLAQMLRHFIGTAGLDTGLATLERLQVRNAELGDGFSPQAFAQISHECRWVICDQISNPFVAQTWIDTYYLASRVWFLCLSTEQKCYGALQSDELAQLVKAFRTRDPDAIAQAVHDTLKAWSDVIRTSIVDGLVPIHVR